MTAGIKNMQPSLSVWGQRGECEWADGAIGRPRASKYVIAEDHGRWAQVWLTVYMTSINKFIF